MNLKIHNEIPGMDIKFALTKMTEGFIESQWQIISGVLDCI